MDAKSRAEAHRQKMAQRSREQSNAVADIGDLPAVADPERREACRLDLLRFLATYFPASTGLKPFGEDHQRAIQRIQTCALEGGLFVQAFPRGFGKTTISENAAIWAVIYGHRRFVPIFGADANGASGNIDSIKLELSENDLLYADFPEVCHAIRALEGKPQRCASQTFEGELTHIEWTAEQIVLPTIPNSIANGAILSAKGITGASRGMKHKRPDGAQQRPDFIIIDDPQTDESAGSPLQVNKRLDVIRKSILKLGGHNRKIAVVMNATVIRPDDLVEILLDPKRSPNWQGERIPMVRSFSEAHETLWLDDYARIRNTYDPQTLGDQQRAHREATEFYRRNRPKMDVGCVVSWEHCFDAITEISAVQHAYNCLIDDGEDVFASECQNQPHRQKDEGSADALTPEQVASKLNNMGRATIATPVSRIVAFVDVQKYLLYWLVCGWEDDFTGYVVDYGTFPDQRRSYFASKDVRYPLAKITKTANLEASLYAGLDATVGNLMHRDWQREDGAVLKPERILIDANWGESSDLVYSFCRQSPYATVLTPSHGKYVGAKGRRFNEYTPKRGDRLGLNWRMPNVQARRSVRYVVFDTNFWKSFIAQRLKTPQGGRGCLSIFGDKAEEHRLLADHLTSERPVVVEANDRRVVEWELPPSRPDNHWLDCLVGCGVAASIQGARMKETEPAKPRRKRISFAELQARRMRTHG